MRKEAGSLHKQGCIYDTKALNTEPLPRMHYQTKMLAEQSTNLKLADTGPDQIGSHFLKKRRSKVEFQPKLSILILVLFTLHGRGHPKSYPRETSPLLMCAVDVACHSDDGTVQNVRTYSTDHDHDFRSESLIQRGSKGLLNV